MSTQVIQNRTILTPNNFQRQMIEKLYDKAVYEKTIVEKVDYLSDGLTVKGYIARPKELGKYPVLLWNRGGYKDSGALDELTSFLILASTAVWGYIVVASNYRGNMGGEGKEDWGGKDVDDALMMLEVAEEIESADMSRMAIEGASRGCMTTYRALVKDDRFRCAIAHAGLADLFEMEAYDEHFAKLIDKITLDLAPDEKQRKLASLSGVYLAEKFPQNCPILLMHGDNDNRVPISQTEAIAAELKRVGHDHEFHIIPGGGHIALKDGSYKAIDNLRKVWLKKYLG